MFVYELEKHLISKEKWGIVPQKVIDALGEPLEEAVKSGPVGVGYTKETGWFILMCGQGPFIFWLERESEGEYKNASDGRREQWTASHCSQNKPENFIELNLGR